MSYVWRAIEAIILLLVVAIGVGFVYYHGTPDVKGTVIFGLTALCVMIFYFVEDWIKASQRRRLLDYLVFDNPGDAYDAVKRLVMLCVGSGLVGHFSHMSLTEIITAGAGIGLVAFRTNGREVH